MIDRTLLDASGRELLALHRLTPEAALWVRDEGMPETTRTGTVRQVAGGTVQVLTGRPGRKAGQFTLSLGLAGRTHGDALALLGEVQGAVEDARRYQRSGKGVLLLAGPGDVGRPKWTGNAQVNCSVDVTWDLAARHWVVREQSQDVPVSVPTAVTVLGRMTAGLRVTITAGGAGVTNPSILTDMGLTTYLGTIPAGGVLVIDGTPGIWAATLNGTDARLKLSGPQPALLPGERSVTVTAPGATAHLDWMEGDL